jgi:hypothetical protein
MIAISILAKVAGSIIAKQMTQARAIKGINSFAHNLNGLNKKIIRVIGMASQPVLDSVVNAMKMVKPRQSIKIIF